METIKSVLYSYPPPPPRTRTRPFRVICVGLPRSATESLSHALEKLGLRPYHGWNLVFDSPEYIEQWARLAKRKYAGDPDGDVHISKAEFDALIGDHDAVLDSVPAMFAAELIEAYPEAKVILNTRRDLDAWHKSIMKTIVGIEDSWFQWLIKVFNADMFWVWEVYFTYAYCGLFRSPVKQSSRDGISRNGKWVYRDHCNMVRGMVEKQRLLEWAVEDGWRPLCEFLGEEVPDEPFPRGNDPAAFDEMAAKRVKPRIGGALCNMAITAISVSVVATLVGVSVKERGVPWKTIGGISSTVFADLQENVGGGRSGARDRASYFSLRSQAS
ncbi:hypothetical protein BO70DRAFT_394008 [Aspergillus heteromorphus CBS 117.55]|uniref:NAD dependent epimerase/dehydratase n=1 Tax=Aspergillus heteromorphus CBS 117.55 TaxID=1448321 RepID=A0A317WPD2_9EURO|nr:uncharacterized protein BO70DRAFT_394008 [Aspergillus heteromorphus CBS 117.55]PWY88289.1 hypothetical protein BO70DRAFT_394008 [Aspergillus heteromorphus CBS 117.55]